MRGAETSKPSIDGYSSESKKRVPSITNIALKDDGVITLDVQLAADSGDLAPSVSEVAHIPVDAAVSVVKKVAGLFGGPPGKESSDGHGGHDHDRTDRVPQAPLSTVHAVVAPRA